MKPPKACRTMPAEHALELEHFLPYRLSVLSNRISQDDRPACTPSASAWRVTEWRVMAVLGRYPDLSRRAKWPSARRWTRSRSAARWRACWSAAGRSATPTATTAGARCCGCRAAGYAIYDEVAPLALAYEQRLLAGLDENDARNWTC